MQEHDLRKIPNSFSDLNFPVSALVASRKQLASNLACGVSLLFKESGQVLHSGGQKNALGNRGQFQSIPNDDKWSQAMTRNRLTQLFALLLMAAMTTTVFAFPPPEGKGGGKGGGDEEPPPPPEVELPPIEYVPTVIPFDFPFAGAQVRVNDYSDAGWAVGYHKDSDSPREGWLYAPDLAPNQVIDLNDPSLEIVGLNRDEWFIGSVLGVNNEGLLVGYVTSTTDVLFRRGFVLDYYLLEMHFLDDLPQGWDDTYARKVNDNGDILGAFLRADGTTGAYIVNTGAIAAEYSFPIEILRDDDGYELETLAMGSGDIQNVNSEIEPFISGRLSGTGIFSFRRDLPLWIQLGVNSGSSAMNDFGDLASYHTATEVVQVRKNKTETVTTNYLYRNINGIEEYIELSYQFITYDMNNDGTVLGPKMLYADGYGVVDLDALISDSSISLQTTENMNNVGVGGFSQIAGVNRNVTLSRDELIILTPIEVAP